MYVFTKIREYKTYKTRFASCCMHCKKNLVILTTVFLGHHAGGDSYNTRRKTFTHEKREQVGMDLVRSTEANRNHTSMHVIINTHPCNSLYIYIVATICARLYIIRSMPTFFKLNFDYHLHISVHVTESV